MATKDEDSSSPRAPQRFAEEFQDADLWSSPDEGRLAAARIRNKELQAELDPRCQNDPARLLRMIRQCAQRAEALNKDDALAPGIELIARVAAELESELRATGSSARKERRPNRGDLRDRHLSALNELIPAAMVLVADVALNEAAEFGNRAREEERAGPPLDEEEEPMEEGEEFMPESQADALAIEHVRFQLGVQLPRTATDEQILDAVRVYRLPRAGRGRRSRGEATDIDRMAVVRMLLQLEPDPSDLARELRKYRNETAERVNRLTRKSLSQSGL